MKTTILCLAIAAGALSGCSTGNPQTDRNVRCAGGILGGATVGGLVGNQFGGGSGRSAATAVGAGAGAATGIAAAC